LPAAVKKINGTAGPESIGDVADLQHLREDGLVFGTLVPY